MEEFPELTDRDGTASDRTPPRLNLHALKNWVRHGSAAGVLPAGRLTDVVESVFIDAIGSRVCCKTLAPKNREEW
jgi:hypothetical protein